MYVVYFCFLGIICLDFIWFGGIVVYFVVMEWELEILRFNVSSNELVLLLVINLRFNISSIEVVVLGFIVIIFVFSVVSSWDFGCYMYGVFVING